MLVMRTMLSPYKLVIHGSGRVELEVTVENRSSERKLVSITLEVPYELALNTGGFVRRDERRLGYIKPGERKKVIFTIYSRPTTEPGKYELKITGTEHEDSYEYVMNESRKSVILTVVP